MILLLLDVLHKRTVRVFFLLRRTHTQWVFSNIPLFSCTASFCPVLLFGERSSPSLNLSSEQSNFLAQSSIFL